MEKRLYRSKEQRMVAGVFGGIGEYYGIDPTVIRLVYIFIAVFTWVIPAIVAYIIAIVVIPEEPGGSVVRSTNNSNRTDSHKSDDEVSSS